MTERYSDRSSARLSATWSVSRSSRSHPRETEDRDRGQRTEIFLLTSGGGRGTSLQGIKTVARETGCHARSYA